MSNGVFCHLTPPRHGASRARLALSYPTRFCGEGRRVGRCEDALSRHRRSSPRPACGERSRAPCERVRGSFKQARTRGCSPSPGDFAARRLRPLPASGARLRFTLSLRAERSNPWLGTGRSKMDCFAPLAMTAKYCFAISSTPPRSRRRRASFAARFARLKLQRAQGMPGARCARGLACKNKKAYEYSHHGHTGVTRHSPRNGFNGFLRALPGDRALLPPSLADRSTNLMPASGHQNHTTSPSASRAVRQKHHRRPSHPVPRS